MQKKAALELSINAIVIVILAMILLGLGVGFIRNMFSNIGDTTTQVQDQMREQILDDLRRGDKKLSFPSASIELEPGDEEVIVIGVKNVQSSSMDFTLGLEEITTANGVTTSTPISSSSAPTGASKYSFFWDTNRQTLGAGEANVYPITFATTRTASGTKLFKIIVNETVVGTTPSKEYTSKTFFVKFI